MSDEPVVDGTGGFDVFDALTTVAAGLSAAVRDGIARRASRYDLVLAVIPAAFLAAVAVGAALSLPPEVAMLGAAAVGAVALGDALFVNPPDGTGR
jgi:hypothetical protein